MLNLTLQCSRVFKISRHSEFTSDFLANPRLFTLISMLLILTYSTADEGYLKRSSMSVCDQDHHISIISMKITYNFCLPYSRPMHNNMYK